MFHIDRTEIQEQLKARGIDPDHIKGLHIKLQSGELDQSSFVIPQDRLTAPTTTDAVLYNLKAASAGQAALKADELLVFWLNGGAATRYFDVSKLKPAEQSQYGATLASMAHLKDQPKGVTPVANGMSYLELKVRDLLRVSKDNQLESHPQVIVMNSFVTDQQTREHFELLFEKYPDLDRSRIHFIVQEPRIPRFTKAADLKEIDLFVDSQNQLSWAPCGHGDFVYLLKDYLQHHPIANVRYMYFANIDNLAATIDPALLGQHLQSGRGRSVEVVPKLASDQGGVPCKVDGELVIVEQMKFPAGFDYQALPWLNTNTFWFTLADLLSFNEDLPWVLAEKTITDGNVIQLERFACDVNLPSQYIIVERQQRFWPMKRYVDVLISQTQPEFQTLLRDRFSVTL